MAKRIGMHPGTAGGASNAVERARNRRKHIPVFLVEPADVARAEGRPDAGRANAQITNCEPKEMRVGSARAPDVAVDTAPLRLDLAISLPIDDRDRSHLAVGVACGADLG